MIYEHEAIQTPISENNIGPKMGSGPVRLVGKAQNWHKVDQVWCAVEFLLISSKTDKETLAKCLSVSGHGNSPRSGKLYPPSCVSTRVK